jgi:hypothetical protein
VWSSILLYTQRNLSWRDERRLGAGHLPVRLAVQTLLWSLTSRSRTARVAGAVATIHVWKRAGAFSRRRESHAKGRAHRIIYSIYKGKITGERK